MKKSWIITILLCLFIIVSGIVAVRWPRTVPLSQCSELYRHYADNHDIHASFIKDFRINDTLALDVTVLKATTDSAWFLLRDDFNLLPPSGNNSDTSAKSRTLQIQLVSKTDTKTKDPDPEKNDILVASAQEQTLLVFNTRNQSEREAIISFKLIEISTH